jgi:endogenous inhibitor of DNA gyrase (YacG/DUF329 family)
MTQTSPQVPCPSCRKHIAWNTDNPSRPFCSERCKTEDFIAWADEQLRITGHGQDEDALQP